MLTLGAIKKDKFAVFDKIDDNFTRLNQINALVYIENLAGLTQTNIQDWPVLEIFKSDSELIVTSKVEINQRFFQAKNETVAPKISTVLDPKQLLALKQLSTYIVPNERKGIEERITRHRRALNDYHGHIRAQVQAIMQETTKLAQLQEINFDLAAKISPALDSGLWKLKVIDGYGWIEFETVNDVFLSYNNASQGVRISAINMGKFVCTLNVKDGNFLVDGAGNNMKVYGYIHPHIDGGNLCTGDLWAQFAEARTTHNISKLLDITWRVLNSYNHDSMYINLVQFDRLARGLGPISGIYDHQRSVSSTSVYYPIWQKYIKDRDAEEVSENDEPEEIDEENFDNEDDN
jgi:hypothetical protein